MIADSTWSSWKSPRSSWKSPSLGNAEECPKRVAKLISSLRDLRQEMHDLTENFEAILIKGGSYVATDKPMDKAEFQRVRTMMRVSEMDRAGGPLALTLKSRYCKQPRVGDIPALAFP